MSLQAGGISCLLTEKIFYQLCRNKTSIHKALYIQDVNQYLANQWKGVSASNTIKHAASSLSQ